MLRGKVWLAPSQLADGYHRFAIELPLLVLGSMVAGWVIGAAQHFFAFRIWGCGLKVIGDCSLSASEFLLSFWEGGIVGAVIAIPTGLIAWYAILRRRAVVAQVRAVVMSSLLGGCLLGAAFGARSPGGPQLPVGRAHFPDSVQKALRGRMSQLNRHSSGRAVSWRRIVAILP
jgi:hypothetical protein